MRTFSSTQSSTRLCGKYFQALCSLRICSDPWELCSLWEVPIAPTTRATVSTTRYIHPETFRLNKFLSIVTSVSHPFTMKTKYSENFVARATVIMGASSSGYEHSLIRNRGSARWPISLDVSHSPPRSRRYLRTREDHLASCSWAGKNRKKYCVVNCQTNSSLPSPYAWLKRSETRLGIPSL